MIAKPGPQEIVETVRESESPGTAMPDKAPITGLVSEVLTFSDSSPLKAAEMDLRQLMVALADLQEKARFEKDKAHKEMRTFLSELLEVVDDFHRIFAHLESRGDAMEKQTKILAGNFRTVKRRLDRALEGVGVQIIEVKLGSQADPEKHQIVETLPAPGRPEGSILEVERPGYVWGQEPLRFPEVKTVKNTGSE